MRKKMMKTMAAVAATMALTACTSDNDFSAKPVAGAKTYQVNIPASMGDGGTTRAVSFDGTTSNSTFEAGEEVYVYNATTGEVMLYNKYNENVMDYLQPTNISADGKSCTLSGTLYGNIAATDELLLMYNMNCYNDSGNNEEIKEGSYFSYFNQDGTADGVIDGATATLSGWSNDGGVLTTTGTARFQNLQSMFRFSFMDAAASDPLSVRIVRIYSANNALIGWYYPMRDEGRRYEKVNGCEYMRKEGGEALSGYVYLALCIDEACSPADVLTFRVYDDAGNIYEGSKAVPAAGFKNGKYYYNSAAIALTQAEHRTMPAITWTATSEPVDTDEPEIDGNIYMDDANITLSGTSEGIYFVLEASGTVSLNGLTALYGDYYYIEGLGDDNLTLDISGANSIGCKNAEEGIRAAGLKLQGYGTLTVTAASAEHCGLYGGVNYNPGNNAHATTDAVDVSTQLAAPGYKVVRSARTSNADGTYSWTYTVSPSLTMPLTVEALTAGTIKVDTPRSGMQYSVNGGEKTAMTETTTIDVTAGDKVQFYGKGTSITSYFSSVSGDYTRIAGGTAQVKVYGNIMSLVYETGYATNTTLTAAATFRRLFKSNSHLTDASGLLLPATTLTTRCYAEMFYECTSLTTAPVLPAETLADYCYSNMFDGCTSLTAAPALPAMMLTDRCYLKMFSRCSSLSSVTCLATDISATNCTTDWLNGAGSNVTGTKTFTTPSTTNWGEGASGIPSDWTRVNAQ